MMNHQRYLNCLSRISEGFASPSESDIRHAARHLRKWLECPLCRQNALTASPIHEEQEFLTAYYLVFTENDMRSMKSYLDQIAFILEYKSTYHRLQTVSINDSLTDLSAATF